MTFHDSDRPDCLRNRSPLRTQKINLPQLRNNIFSRTPLPHCRPPSRQTTQGGPFQRGSSRFAHYLADRDYHLPTGVVGNLNTQRVVPLGGLTISDVTLAMLRSTGFPPPAVIATYCTP